MPQLDLERDQRTTSDGLKLSARQKRKTRRLNLKLNGVDVEESLVLSPMSMEQVKANSSTTTPAQSVATNSNEEEGNLLINYKMIELYMYI